MTPHLGKEDAPLFHCIQLGKPGPVSNAATALSYTGGFSMAHHRHRAFMRHVRGAFRRCPHNPTDHIHGDHFMEMISSRPTVRRLDTDQVFRDPIPPTKEPARALWKHGPTLRGWLPISLSRLYYSGTRNIPGRFHISSATPDLLLLKVVSTHQGERLKND